MIVDFSFQNYRSFKDEQVLSLNAAMPGKHLIENIAFPDSKIGTLRTAAIYGANASGKSNILKSIDALSRLIVSSGDLKESQKIPVYNPYVLDVDGKNSEIYFEIEFFLPDNKRYRYSVAFNHFEITSEVLDYYPSRQKANIFSRKSGQTWEEISFGSYYKGGLRRIPFFKNNSYLSKAGNNAGSPEFIRNIYKYFRNLTFVAPDHRFIINDYLEERDNLNIISGLLCNVDTGISGIIMENNEEDSDIVFPSNMPEDMKVAFKKKFQTKIRFSHKSETGEYAYFDEDAESDGTLRLFNLLPLLVEALERGSVVLMDELDSSFHAHIAALVVRLFNDAVVNRRGAQLIFTSHDLTLLKSSRLRRDQIWFVDKKEGSSKLYSLDEYDKKQVTANSPYSIWYDEGRFGAIPNLNYSNVSDIIIKHLAKSEVDGNA